MLRRLTKVSGEVVMKYIMRVEVAGVREQGSGWERQRKDGIYLSFF